MILDKGQILQLRAADPRHYCKVIQKHHAETADSIEKYTSHLKLDTFSQKVYHYVYDLQYYPKCYSCKQVLDNKAFPSISKHGYGWFYRKYCSKKCSSACETRVAKTAESRRKLATHFRDKLSLSAKIIDNQLYPHIPLTDLQNTLTTLLRECNVGSLKIKLLQTQPAVYAAINNHTAAYTKFGEKVYNILSPRAEVDMCIVCKIKPARFSSLHRGYDIVCSKTCKKTATSVSRSEMLSSRKIEFVHSSIVSVVPSDLRSNVVAFTTNNIANSFYQTLAKQQPLIIPQIYKYTNYLRVNCKFSERLHHIIHGYTSVRGCAKCGSTLKYLSFSTGYSGCRNCNYSVSQAERDIRAFLDSLNVIYESNPRNIITGELDIYIPNSNTAIEYNGDYWHSDEYKPASYHLSKTTQCEAKGIQLLHVSSNEWQESNKRRIWESIIRSKVGKVEHVHKIHARKCTIQPVSTQQRREFLALNHMQGSYASSVGYGLFYNTELISVMTFGRARFNEAYEWELIRFCSKLNYIVVGGASRLLAMFVKTQTPKSIISYADRRRSIGNVYTKIGFKLSHHSTPGYQYVKLGTSEVLSRMLCQKHRLPMLLGEKFDATLSESENMKKAGYKKIWDCGNSVFTLTL